MRALKQARHWMAIVGVCLILSITSGARAASFDCKKASTDVEHAICDDPKLNVLDEQISGHYRHLLSESPASKVSDIRTAQRTWLAGRDGCKGAAEGLKVCLQAKLAAREKELDASADAANTALDRIIAGIPADPSTAATQLREYNGPLASAWLLYLHDYEPKAAVSDSEARARRDAALAGLSDDEFAKSVYMDVEHDKDPTRGKPSLTLLRMIIEREGYDQTVERPYVHCFLFARWGDVAYKAFGSLYGSTRDGFAPICPPAAGLFDQAAWKRMDKAMESALMRANKGAGTIRYASYVDWSVLDLRATTTPRDFLKPLAKAEAGDAEKELMGQYEDKQWPSNERAEVVAAMGPARQATARWLVAQRGFSAADADKAARNIVQAWVVERTSFIDDNIDNGD
jgi:uncharacterized protein